ncbi:MAG: diacylglycerol kinase family protein [Candidatus Omnitrophota bacterium]|nr:diacylglycerol kinase family protein [Candidatus Omnitrophota bacterium]
MAKNGVLHNIFRVGRFRDSLKIALKGILYLFLYHRNMRIIFIIGIVTFFAGIFFRLSGIELIALCITITLVFMAEIFNTAIELMMNMVSERYHTRIRVIKDIAAGVVILACLNALAVGCVLFAPRIFKG